MTSNSAPALQMRAESKQGSRSELQQHRCGEEKKLKFLGTINFGDSNDLLTGYDLFKKDFVLQK